MFTKEQIEDHRCSAILHMTDAIKLVNNKSYARAEQELLRAVVLITAILEDETIEIYGEVPLVER